jgi:hypothetical protein
MQKQHKGPLFAKLLLRKLALYLTICIALLQLYTICFHIVDVIK